MLLPDHGRRCYQEALVQIDERCNLHCAHCFVSATKAGESMPYDDITGLLIPRLKACRVERVTLTGGEPTIHPRFTEIIRALRGAGMQVGFCTNATTQAYEEVIASQRWQKLAGLGAQRQRPLWASTDVKNHAYPDTMYVTELVAPGTVNTMPGTTLAAFADHGEVTGDTITGRYHDARRVLDQLATAGVDFDEVTGQLEREGLAKFEKSWHELSDTIAAELHRNHPARQS